MKKIFDFIKQYFTRDELPEDIICTECGFYCTGDGGYFCIDKPSMQETKDV